MPKTLLVISWIMLLTVVAQFYFVGLAVFGATDFQMHAVTGTLLIPVGLVFALLLLVNRRTRRLGWHGGGLFVLLFLQPVLALVPRVDAPAVSAVHPLVALGILFLTLALTRELRTISEQPGDPG